MNQDERAKTSTEARESRIDYDTNHDRCYLFIIYETNLYTPYNYMRASTPTGVNRSLPPVSLISLLCRRFRFCVAVSRAGNRSSVVTRPGPLLLFSVLAVFLPAPPRCVFDASFRPFVLSMPLCFCCSASTHPAPFGLLLTPAGATFPFDRKKPGPSAKKLRSSGLLGFAPILALLYLLTGAGDPLARQNEASLDRRPGRGFAAIHSKQVI